MTSDTPDTKKDLIGHGGDAAGTAPAVETKTAGTAWAEINARIEQQRVEAREQLKTDRAALLAALRETGVEEIEASYEGYADSGNVQYRPGHHRIELRRA